MSATDPSTVEPESLMLAPLLFDDIDGKTALHVQFDIDEVRFSLSRSEEYLAVEISAALELDALIKLRDSIINPAIEHAQALKRAEVEEAERARIELEAKAEERAREQAEREREQTFRGVSVARTVTPNMTIHGRTCTSLEFARRRQTLGTMISALTPDNLIGKIPTAMTGRLSLRFCAKCKPIPEAVRFNAELIGAGPEIVPEDLLLMNISNAIWEGHHAALAHYEERTS